MTDCAVETVPVWYLACARDLHAYAARRVGVDLADDIVAETFRHAIDSFDRFDPTLGNERAWLFVSRRTCCEVIAARSSGAISRR